MTRFTSLRLLSKPSFLSASAAIGLAAMPLPAATLVVDSFTEDDFFISVDGLPSVVSPLTSPFGFNRTVRVNPRNTDGAIVTSTLDSSIGMLSFAVDGQPITPNPLDLRMWYSQGGPFSVLGYNAFEFEFSSLTGTGALIVELGSGSAIYGPETHRIPLVSPGLVSVPFSELNFGTSGSVEQFFTIHFVFEANTEEFSFTLDEIRLVPEPGAEVLALLGLAAFGVRRRRSRGTPGRSRSPN